MAPLTKTLVFAALAAMVSARPLVARAPAPSMVTETAWTTIDVPVTLWVDENGTPLSTVAQGGNFAAVPTTPSTTTAATSTTTPVAIAPVKPASPSTTLATTTSAPAYQPPAPVASSSTTPAPIAPVVPSSYSAAPVAASSAPAAAPASGGSSSDSNVRSVASSTNSCEGSGAACTGDITHYDGGLGACGWNVNTASDMEIALPYEFMGTQSNGNPYCGRSLTIMNPTTGQTVQATVGDKCMGCTGRSIDLTDALFNAIGGGCDGRCSGFDWWFN